MPATFIIEQTTYRIDRSFQLQLPGDRLDGCTRIVCTMLDQDLIPELQWRDQVHFTRDKHGNWFYASWNIGTCFRIEHEAAIVNAIETAVRAFNTPQQHPYRQEVINRALANGIKVTDTHVEQSNTLREVALDFVRTYRGKNSFVQDIAVGLDQYGSLTVAQMRGALNVMIAEARSAQSEATRKLENQADYEARGNVPNKAAASHVSASKPTEPTIPPTSAFHVDLSALQGSFDPRQATFARRRRR